MQTELDIKKTDMPGSADVSSGAANTVTVQEAPNTEAPSQKPEPKKRGRKKGYHHSEATKAAMRKARTGVHPSKETKDKISKAKEGKTHSATAKLKMSDTRRYNFLRKKIESALHGTSTIVDVVALFNRKDAITVTMSEFAENIYKIAHDKVDGLINTKADRKAQNAAYKEILRQIKELYNERIKELSNAN
jgi:hypothetical protein